MIDGVPISEPDYIGAMIGLLVAGHHSTIAGIGQVLHQLVEHPDLLAQLRDDPALIDGVIDETLRLEPSTRGGKASVAA